MKKAIFALSLLMILTLAGGASAQTVRNLTLSRGDTITPASPVTDATGATTFYGGFVSGGVEGTTPGVFTLSLTFRGTGVLDPLAGVYGGAIIPPSGSFAVTEAVGRKSQTTSGTIDAGAVTYRLTADGRAEIISVVSGSLTVWQGKNAKRRAVGNGTLDYGTVTPGAGTMTLFFQ
jgi:hypothetical protein